MFYVLFNVLVFQGRICAKSQKVAERKHTFWGLKHTYWGLKHTYWGSYPQGAGVSELCPRVERLCRSRAARICPSNAYFLGERV